MDISDSRGGHRGVPAKGGSMRVRTLVVGVVCAALALMGTATATAQSSDEKPKATDVGVTAKEIHIAVVADVDNSLAPNLFQGAVDGVKGAAAYLNSKDGGGGLAGRKVVVDFYDSKLNATEARNGAISACQNDFAMVGTSALLLTNIDDVTNCVNKDGEAVGIPDVGGVVIGVPETCGPTSFPGIGAQIICSTKDQHPQSYNTGALYTGLGAYLTKKYKDLHGPWLVSGDSKDGARGGVLSARAAESSGIKVDNDVTMSARAQQTAYTPVVQQMKADGANFAASSVSTNSLILLKSEAEIQGLDNSKIVYACAACYGAKEVDAQKDLLEGLYVAIGHLPFDETKYNTTLANFMKYVGKAKANTFSVFTWEAALGFAEGVKAAVAKHGINGLTRANVMAGMKTLTDFDAGGMAGTHNFKTGAPTQCFVMMQYRSGKWVRDYPAKKGTMDCNPRGSKVTKADLIGI